VPPLPPLPPPRVQIWPKLKALPALPTCMLPPDPSQTEDRRILKPRRRRCTTSDALPLWMDPPPPPPDVHHRSQDESGYVCGLHSNNVFSFSKHIPIQSDHIKRLTLQMSPLI
jgi:hypothetical protein